MQRAIAAVDEAIAQNVPGVLGIHLEGPYLATARKGVHDPRQVPRARRARDRACRVAAPRQDAAHRRARSDRHGGAARTRRARCDRRRGYTRPRLTPRCTPRSPPACVVLHILYNAMTPLSGREPGVVGAALEDRSSWCGIIVDGHHVHPASLRVALAAKPRGKVFLVTDAMPPVGADSPTFRISGTTATVQGTALLATPRRGRSQARYSTWRRPCAIRSTGSACRSTKPRAWRRRIRRISSASAIRGGAIAPGYAADLVALDGELRVSATWIGGEMEICG